MILSYAQNIYYEKNFGDDITVSRQHLELNDQWVI